jgi:AcrR family transcriptional regulator
LCTDRFQIGSIDGMSTTERPLIGRPRAFDPDQALDRALEVFWRQGYEGASLTDLTTAMGITRTSMYAAFGNKEDLFRMALARYTSGPASYVEKALHEPTARSVAEHVLNGAVNATTNPDSPAGCLGVQGALATGAPGQLAKDALIEWRTNGEDAIRERFIRAQAEGDLPPDADPAVLARYIATFAYGISVQAATGVSREALSQMVDTALAGWPTDLS